MPKNLISILLLVAIILTFPDISVAVNLNYSPPATAPQNLTQAKADDNNYLGFSYFVDKLPNGYKLRMEKYSDVEHVLIYGNPSGDYKQGQYRYLGANKLGDYITNINFPNDAVPEGMLDDQKWILEPWTNESLINYLKSVGETLKKKQAF